MTHRTRATAIALAAALTLAACSSGATGDDGSSAGCHGPWLDDDPAGTPPAGSPTEPGATVRPGETITVHGHGYTATCHDTGEHGELEPLGPVALTVRLPGGRALELGELTPRAERTDVGFVATVTVPPGTPSGAAVVSDDRSPATTYRFAVQR